MKAEYVPAVPSVPSFGRKPWGTALAEVAGSGAPRSKGGAAFVKPSQTAPTAQSAEVSPDHSFVAERCTARFIVRRAGTMSGVSTRAADRVCPADLIVCSYSSGMRAAWGSAVCRRARTIYRQLAGGGQAA